VGRKMTGMYWHACRFPAAARATLEVVFRFLSSLHSFYISNNTDERKAVTVSNKQAVRWIETVNVIMKKKLIS
jgi:hypothetical protein